MIGEMCANVSAPFALLHMHNSLYSFPATCQTIVHHNSSAKFINSIVWHLNGVVLVEQKNMFNRPQKVQNNLQ